MLLFVSIVASVIALLVIFTFREKPNATLWSRQSALSNTASAGEMSLVEQLRLCWANKEYIFTGLGTSGIIIHMYVFTTVIGQFVAPYGITEQDFVIKMGLYVYGFGVLGGVLASFVLTCYPQKMKLAAYLVAILSTLALGAFFLSDTKANKADIEVSCGFLGFCLLPILLIAYELAVAQTAHQGVGESMSCGLINVYANFAGFVVAIALTPALEKETESSIVVTFAVLFVNLGLSILFLVCGSLS